MAAKYWLKLYHEMLDDPKVARLPDSSYRRFIECLLLAGELDEDGYLPPIPDMAWRLRIAETTLSQDMSRLALAGVVELKPHDTGERWFVTKFSERQAAVSDADRMARYRERKRKTPTDTNEKRNSNAVVTKRNTDIDIDIDKMRVDVDSDAHTPAMPANEYIPEPIHQLITALADISKTPHWVKTEGDYTDAAYCLAGMNVTPADLPGFSGWWNANGFYAGKPALKTILDEWKSYTGGVKRQPATQKGPMIPAPESERVGGLY